MATLSILSLRHIFVYVDFEIYNRTHSIVAYVPYIYVKLTAKASATIGIWNAPKTLAHSWNGILHMRAHIPVCIIFSNICYKWFLPKMMNSLLCKCIYTQICRLIQYAQFNIYSSKIHTHTHICNIYEKG